MPLPHAKQVSIRSDGVTFDNIGVLDTSDGAQKENEIITRSSRDDPSSDHFMVCMNKSCRYRENCLRYRLSNKRAFKAVFFPEDCRRDGIFMSIDNNSDFKAYDSMDIIESTSTPGGF